MYCLDGQVCINLNVVGHLLFIMVDDKIEYLPRHFKHPITVMPEPGGPGGATGPPNIWQIS